MDSAMQTSLAASLDIMAERQKTEKDGDREEKERERD